MLPAALFHNQITIQTRDLESDSDPMSSSSTWVTSLTAFSMIAMVGNQKPYDSSQPMALQQRMKFTLRGQYTFPLGETRIVWDGKTFEPYSMEFHPGLFRNEDLTYVYAERTDGLTLP